MTNNHDSDAIDRAFRIRMAAIEALAKPAPMGDDAEMIDWLKTMSLIGDSKSERMSFEVAAIRLQQLSAEVSRLTTERDNALANCKSAILWLIDLGVDPAAISQPNEGTG